MWGSAAGSRRERREAGGQGEGRVSGGPERLQTAARRAHAAPRHRPVVARPRQSPPHPTPRRLTQGGALHHVDHHHALQPCDGLGRRRAHRQRAAHAVAHEERRHARRARRRRRTTAAAAAGRARGAWQGAWRGAWRGAAAFAATAAKERLPDGHDVPSHRLGRRGGPAWVSVTTVFARDAARADCARTRARASRLGGLGGRGSARGGAPPLQKSRGRRPSPSRRGRACRARRRDNWAGGRGGTGGWRGVAGGRGAGAGEGRLLQGWLPRALPAGLLPPAPSHWRAAPLHGAPRPRLGRPACPRRAARPRRGGARRARAAPVLELLRHQRPGKPGVPAAMDAQNHCALGAGGVHGEGAPARAGGASDRSDTPPTPPKAGPGPAPPPSGYLHGLSVVPVVAPLPQLHGAAAAACGLGLGRALRRRIAPALLQHGAGDVKAASGGAHERLLAQRRCGAAAAACTAGRARRGRRRRGQALVHLEGFTVQWASPHDRMWRRARAAHRRVLRADRPSADSQPAAGGNSRPASAAARRRPPSPLHGQPRGLPVADALGVRAQDGAE
jgi:hypothetical protein